MTLEVLVNVDGIFRSAQDDGYATIVTTSNIIFPTSFYPKSQRSD
jgi:hypothetical protein